MTTTHGLPRCAFAHIVKILATVLTVNSARTAATNAKTARNAHKLAPAILHQLALTRISAPLSSVLDAWTVPTAATAPERSPASIPKSPRSSYLNLTETRLSLQKPRTPPRIFNLRVAARTRDSTNHVLCSCNQTDHPTTHLLHWRPPIRLPTLDERRHTEHRLLRHNVTSIHPK